jgi:hypothetical protein
MFEISLHQPRINRKVEPSSKKTYAKQILEESCLATACTGLSDFIVR